MSFRRLFVVVVSFALAWAFVGCSHEGTSLVSPSTGDPSLPPVGSNRVQLVSVSPPSGTFVDGSGWQVEVNLLCASNNYWYSLYMLRDDGVRELIVPNSPCIGRNIEGQGRGRGSRIYNFGRGHEVVVRVAYAESLEKLRGWDLVYDSPTEIVRWYVEP